MASKIRLGLQVILSLQRKICLVRFYYKEHLLLYILLMHLHSACICCTISMFFFFLTDISTCISTYVSTDPVRNAETFGVWGMHEMYVCVEFWMVDDEDFLFLCVCVCVSRVWMV